MHTQALKSCSSTWIFTWLLIIAHSYGNQISWYVVFDICNIRFLSTPHTVRYTVIIALYLSAIQLTLTPVWPVITCHSILPAVRHNTTTPAIVWKNMLLMHNAYAAVLLTNKLHIENMYNREYQYAAWDASPDEIRRTTRVLGHNYVDVFHNNATHWCINQHFNMYLCVWARESELWLMPPMNKRRMMLQKWEGREEGGIFGRRVKDGLGDWEDKLSAYLHSFLCNKSLTRND